MSNCRSRRADCKYVYYSYVLFKIIIIKMDNIRNLLKSWHNDYYDRYKNNLIVNNCYIIRNSEEKINNLTY